MNLHRTGKRPQWEAVDPEKRNRWQRVAAHTHGLVTPANIATAVGVGVGILGLEDIRRGHRLRGSLLLGASRLPDYVDGKLAEHYGTKSPLGEALDAGSDKMMIFSALKVVRQHNLLPTSPAILFGAQNVANAGLTALAKARHQEIHPGASGKLATGLQWTAIGFFGFAAVARENQRPELERSWNVAAATVTGIATVLGAKATQELMMAVFTGAAPETSESDTTA